MAERKKAYPVYVDRMPPCNSACPSGHNIQGWLAATKCGDYKKAWEIMMENNPIPASMGRICYYPCEHACNRHAYDVPVNINAVERYVGDAAITEGWAVEKNAKLTGKKVLIVGAGPAGLSAAYQLCLLGHDVTIYERHHYAGGTMHTGIPSYRLPRNILNTETKRIEDLGVKFVFNRLVEDLEKEKKDGDFDAVFVATGAQLGRAIKLTKEGSQCSILDACKFLEEIEFGPMPKVQGLKVAVYGGGNTAIDAARCAVRLGAAEVEIVYRRNREKMPAYDFEVAEAFSEGIALRLLRTIERIDNKSITLNEMELDGEGWPCPNGKQEIIEADVVIMALGLNVETDFLRKVEGLEFKKDGAILVDSNDMSTKVPGIYAGGDVVPFDRSVTTAIGHGKKAARSIDAYLNSCELQKKEKHECAGLDKVHTDYYSQSARKHRHKVGFTERNGTFDEVVNGLTELDVLHESKRCFSCGNCFECDTCLNVCPVDAISKHGHGYKVDMIKCIGCGLCAKKCPCGAIRMEKRD